MIDFLKKIIDHIIAKLWQYITSVGGGLLIAFESSIPFFMPCVFVTVLDVWSAYSLSKRIHKRFPDKTDGKFKSEYKYRVMHTLIIALIALILGAYVDILVFKEGNRAICTVFGFFLCYQSWSVLENCSSENNKMWAKVLQRIMVNKAERHFNVPLSDILLKEKEVDNEKDK